MFHAWIREDTNSGKLYYRIHADSADRLFMDLAMQPGDSLYFPEAVIKLKSVDSVLINGIYHIVQDFGYQVMLEGIGPKYGSLGGLTSPYHAICCFESNGQRPVLQMAKVWFDNVNSCVTSVDVISSKAKAKVLPNPLTPDSRIILPQLAEIAKLKIMNTAGLRVVDKTFRHVREILLDEYKLPAGVYFYTVKDAKLQDAYKGKFTVQ